MFGMGEEFVSESMFWEDADESWAFPILPSEENGGKILIEGGRIVTDAEREEAPPPPQPVVKARKRAKASLKHGGSSGDQGNNQGNGGSGGSGGGGDSDEHEIHIWTERERRKKMRNMFASLHDLIPKIHPRADKSTIVDEAILYIRRLHVTLDTLEKKKSERLKGGNANPTSCDLSTVTQSLAIPSREAFMAEQGSTSTQGAVTLSNPNQLFSGPEYPPVFKTWTSPNLTLNVCGKDAHISICCPKKLGFLTAILFVVERYKLEVVSAQVSSDRGNRMYMIHTRINGGPNQFPEAFIPVEEIFKQAAAEIMLWLNS